MLIIAAYVNDRLIDEVWIQNVDHISGDTCKYKIRKPEGDWPDILHKRSDGWKRLAMKALGILKDEGTDQYLRLFKQLGGSKRWLKNSL